MLATILAASNGITIDCIYYTSDFGYNLSSIYACQSFVSTLDNNEAITAVTDSGATADPSLTTADVKWFTLGNGYSLKIDRIPSNMATIFPNLVGIQWIGTKLKELSPSDLLPYPNLVFLIVSGNMLRKLDGNLFQNNHQLQYLELSQNAISEIGPGFLNGCNALTFFSIYGNICTGQSSPFYLSQPDNTLSDLQRGLAFVCGPEDNEPTSSDACLANCTARAVALQTRVNILTESVNAPWYYKLRMFLKAVLLW